MGLKVIEVIMGSRSNYWAVWFLRTGAGFGALYSSPPHAQHHAYLLAGAQYTRTEGMTSPEHLGRWQIFPKVTKGLHGSSAPVTMEDRTLSCLLSVWTWAPNFLGLFLLLHEDTTTLYHHRMIVKIHHLFFQQILYGSLPRARSNSKWAFNESCLSFHFVSFCTVFLYSLVSSTLKWLVSFLSL